jgi:hypothetical protein
MIRTLKWHITPPFRPGACARVRIAIRDAPLERLSTAPKEKARASGLFLFLSEARGTDGRRSVGRSPEAAVRARQAPPKGVVVTADAPDRIVSISQ